MVDASVYIMDMKNDTFQISGNEYIELGQDSIGAWVARHVKDSKVIGQRSAFGTGEQGLTNATKAARQWAFGIRYDRSR
jgi:hypothetical protein